MSKKRVWTDDEKRRFADLPRSLKNRIDAYRVAMGRPAMFAHEVAGGSPRRQ